MKAAWIVAVALAACPGDDGDHASGTVDAAAVTARACTAAPGARQRVLAPFASRVELADGAVWSTDRDWVWRWAMDATPPAQFVALPEPFASGLRVSGDELFLEGRTAVWRWTIGGSAWESLPLPAAELVVGELEALPGGGVVLSTFCLNVPASCTSGSPLLRLAPGSTAFETLSAGPVRPGWTTASGALFFQRAAGSAYETVQHDLGTGAERVVYVSQTWEEAHPPLAVDGDVIYAAMGDSGPSMDQTPGAIEERSVIDGSRLRTWAFPRTPTKFLVDRTHLYWIDPGWVDIGPMPRPSEGASVRRLARRDGTDETIATSVPPGVPDVALTADAVYYTNDGALWCLRK